MMTQPLVFFIHGVNTFGDDQFHVGPLAFGPMYKHWKPILEKAGFEFFAVDEMGFGDFDEQVGRAFLKIQRTLPGQTSNIKRGIHLFGHSMGGLIARGVGARLMGASEFTSRAHLRSIITLGTPHEGTTATERTLNLQSKNPGASMFLKYVGYNTEERREALSYFTVERIKAFAARHPVLEGVDCVSLVGAAERKKLGLPFQLFYRQLHPRGEEVLSDGLIAASTQEWAHVGGRFELDHGAELGAISNVLPSDRRFAAREFKRLANTVIEIIKKADSK